MKEIYVVVCCSRYDDHGQAERMEPIAAYRHRDAADTEASDLNDDRDGEQEWDDGSSTHEWYQVVTVPFHP